MKNLEYKKVEKKGQSLIHKPLVTFQHFGRIFTFFIPRNT